MIPRPKGVSKRDLLVGILGVTAVTLDKHPALDIASKACEPIFALPEGAMIPKNWYPVIDIAHARAAIAYAGRALKLGALTQEEHDWVCEKARRAIMQGDAPDAA